MTNKAAQLSNQWIKETDAILVTASNGFSISEGLNLFTNDKKLREVLGDLVDKYHLYNLLLALGYPYPNQLDQRTSKRSSVISLTLSGHLMLMLTLSLLALKMFLKLKVIGLKAYAPLTQTNMAFINWVKKSMIFI